MRDTITLDLPEPLALGARGFSNSAPLQGHAERPCAST